MDTYNFIAYIKTGDIYKSIAEDVEIRLNRSLPKGKNKKLFRLMTNEWGGKIMKKFIRLIAKTYSYLIDDGSENKKSKKDKKVCHKKKT